MKRRVTRNEKLRSISQLSHLPSGKGKGKWHNRRTLWAYKLAQRKRRNRAEASRAANRAA